MSKALLDALAVLYHDTDSEAKRRASQWLEGWRLKSDAWNVSVSVLHSQRTDINVLLFCAETLSIKAAQDFEQLNREKAFQLRDSLILLLLKFGLDENHVDIRNQIALAIGAVCAHADESFWHPKTCIQWLIERLDKDLNSTYFSCLIELLVAIPKQARYYTTGLRPERRNEWEKQLQDQFTIVLELLEKFRDLVSIEQSLRVLGNWIECCDLKTLQSNLHRLKPFVDLAIVSLHETNSSFSFAVHLVNNLLGSINHVADNDAADDYTAEEEEECSEEEEDCMEVDECIEEVEECAEEVEECMEVEECSEEECSEEECSEEEEYEALYPEVKEFFEDLANELLKLLPRYQQLCQTEGELELIKGVAKLFCTLGLEHEQLILAKTRTSEAILDAIQLVTSHPDLEIHSFAFEFWEKCGPYM